MIVCPTCGVWASVLDTRKREGNTTKRRYKCANEHRFDTLETVIPTVRRAAPAKGKHDDEGR